MKELALSVIFMFCCFLSAYSLDEVTYPRKSPSIEKSLDFHVPSEYSSIQSAIDAAFAAGGNNISILVEEGEYRESIVADGLKNLKLIGKMARILPPRDFEFTDIPGDDNFPVSSITLINCENFRVEGFTFIGDDFAESIVHSFPMGNAIHLYNSTGTVCNNIIFNYFDGIFFQVDDPRWMKGDISDNYIHNCLWSGILATGSHNLKIVKNNIAFTIPKTLSISVGIWADGGIGIISENQISHFKAMDFHPQQLTGSGSDLWRARFRFTEIMDYQVFDNSFEQSADRSQLSKVEMPYNLAYRILPEKLRLNNHYISVGRESNTSNHSNMVMLPK